MKKTKTVELDTVPTPAPVKEKKITLSLRFREYILSGLKDEEIYAKIKTEFPTFGEKKTHNRYAAWYRSQIKSELKSESV